MERLLLPGMDARDLKGVRLAAIGPKTAEALESVMLRPDLVPSEYRAEAILDALSQHSVRDKRFLMPRAMVAREILPEKLREWGAQVDVVPAYQTVLPQQDVHKIGMLLSNCEIDCLTFTSSSTVSNFFALISKEDLLRCAGPDGSCLYRSYNGPDRGKVRPEDLDYALRIHYQGACGFDCVLL